MQIVVYRYRNDMPFKLGHVILFVGSTYHVEQAIVSCQLVKMFDYSCGIHSTCDVKRGEFWIYVSYETLRAWT